MAELGKQKKRKILTEIGIGLFTALVTIVLTQEIFFELKPLKELELKFIDSRFLRRGQLNIKDSSQVIIVEITQETYDGIPIPYNSWPWPRFIFAKLIENLTKAGAKAVGIDIVMSYPDKFSSLNDSLLVEAIRRSSNVVVAGKVDITREAVVSSQKKYELLSENYTESAGLIKKLNETYGNIFYTADSSVGIVQVPNDHDGVYRRYYPFVYSNVTSRRIPSFGFAILNKFYNMPANYTVEVRDEDFYGYGKSIPKFDRQSVLINFYGSNRTFTHRNFLDVIDDKDFLTNEEIELNTQINTWDNPDYGYLYSGQFKDKIVIVGSTMPEDKDLMPVSFSKGERQGDNLLYGVEFHANVIQNILSSDFLYRQSAVQEIFLTITATFLIFFFSSYLRRIKLKYGFYLEVINFLLVVLLIFALYEMSMYLFIHSNYLMTLVSPISAVVLGYVSSTAYHFIRERKQSSMIKGMFSHYVSGTLVNELLADPDKLRLGGERKNITVLFSDIAGFTTFSEKKDPEELVSLINEYLSEMTEIILDNNGTLDKYLGDAVMAFWGAPIPIENHSLSACKTALSMQESLVDISRRWSKAGESQLAVRIGINSGDAVVGNIGGLKRFDYTVMGDTVNLASRLEGANKEYGTKIMISESTYSAVKDDVLVRELDNIIVKGKTKPIVVYELIGLKNNSAAEQNYLRLENYFKGIELYKRREFSSAIVQFEEALKLNGEDFPSKVYLERSKIYLASPPPADWNGVFILKSK